MFVLCLRTFFSMCVCVCVSTFDALFRIYKTNEGGHLFMYRDDMSGAGDKCECAADIRFSFVYMNRFCEEGAGMH